ncbi:MAG: type II toxin-antitoxin system VapC family toxin [Lysobacterales bacterium]
MGLIFLDANVLIYAMESSSSLGQRTREALQDKPDSRFAFSSLIKMECLVVPIRKGNTVLQKRYETWFTGLELLPMSDDVYMQAAVLRAHFGLKTPDALHLACAQHHGCEALWTNDDRLAKAGHGLAVNILA